jgi:hypothetical protein
MIAAHGLANKPVKDPGAAVFGLFYVNRYCQSGMYCSDFENLAARAKLPILALYPQIQCPISLSKKRKTQANVNLASANGPYANVGWGYSEKPGNDNRIHAPDKISFLILMIRRPNANQNSHSY